MAWIESHQDLRSNPKTKRAARQLGTTVPAIMGHLHCLWHWALDHAFSGDLSPFDPEDIAEAAEWDGDADTFVKVLTNCGPGDKAGFLEVDGPTAEGGCGLLVLHDWAEFTAHLRERREASRVANHERWHVKRKRPDPDCSLCTLPPESDGTPSGEVADSEDAPSGLHRPTDLPNQNQGDAEASPSVPGLAERFAAWWDAYPRHAKNGKPGGGGSRKTAESAFNRLSERKRQLAEQALPHYRAWVESPDGEYPAHASTWLHEERWEQWQEPAELRSRDGPQPGTGQMIG